MKKNICRMKTHDSLWPSNIDTADVLVIDEPCKVTDAYYLFTDRPKIKTIKIAGHSYSRQELSNMEPHLHLGGGFIEERPLVNPAPIPVPPIAGGTITWDPEPMMIFTEDPVTFETWTQQPEQQPQTTPRPTLAEVNNLAEIRYHTVRNTYMSPEYQRAFEALRRDHPNYMQFGDIAIADGYTQA